MELAAALHHSASKSAGPETNDAIRSQKTVNSTEEGVFFELYDEDTAGWWPASLAEPRPPQERVQRRTVEQIADFASMVQVLEVHVPQVVLGVMQDQILQRIVMHFLMDDTEQVIDAPKIFRPDLHVVLFSLLRRWLNSWWKCRWSQQLRSSLFTGPVGFEWCGVPGARVCYRRVGTPHTQWDPLWDSGGASDSD